MKRCFFGWFSILLLLGCGELRADRVVDRRFNKASAAAQPEERREPDFFASAKQGVQVTELGCMRVTFLFDEAAAAFETQVLELFSDADFRVFPNGEVIKRRLQPGDFYEIGNDRFADLVVFTRVTGRKLPALAGRIGAHEAEAVVQVYHPLSEELLVSTTVMKKGEMSADPVVAERTAFKAAVDAAAKETILKTLEKAHKVLVHEAQIKGVMDERHLLEIMEYTARLKGVYHVRQLKHDPVRKVAVMEIIGSPQTETFWKAYMEGMPRRELILGEDGVMRVVPNEALRERLGESWFK